MSKFLIVDDHDVVGKGLTMLLKREHPRARVLHVNNAGDALAVLDKGDVTLLLLDIRLRADDGSDGIDLLKKIRRIHGGIPVLVISGLDEVKSAVRAFRAGAAGFIGKAVPVEDILGAVAALMAGETYLGSHLSGPVLRQMAAQRDTITHELLSDRELQVFRMIASDMTVKEIAYTLKISDKTVATYVSRIHEKTGLGSPVAIARYALMNDLV